MCLLPLIDNNIYVGWLVFLLLTNDICDSIVFPKGKIFKSFDILFIFFPKKLPNIFSSSGHGGKYNNDNKYKLLYCL